MDAINIHALIPKPSAEELAEFDALIKDSLNFSVESFRNRAAAIVQRMLSSRDD